MPKPREVFTPGKLPIEQHNVYASRGSAERDLQKALERGLIPIVFGEYAVGKTSLVRHHLRADDSAKRLVNIESVAGKSMSDILRRCLEVLGYEIVESETRATDVKLAVTAGAEGAGMFAPFIARLRGDAQGSIGRRSERTTRLAVTSPTDAGVLDVCEQRHAVLVLDEMHEASHQLISDTVALLKSFANRNCKHFRIVLVGTASDASRLVDRDPGIDRLLQEVHLRSMTDSESRFIITEGMKRLRIAMPAGDVDSVVKSAVGSPNIVQYLSLEVAERAFPRSSRKTTPSDVREAREDYMQKRSRRLQQAYVTAIETVGPRRYRKQILHAVAAIEDEFVTMEQIRQQVSRQLGVEVPSTALSGPLRVLKEEFGPVLKDVERHEGGERVYNYTRFVDPSMKSFIRFLLALPPNEAS